MDIPSLFMIPSAVSSGKVHSVFPNSTDADFDFNRDSDATRVNSEGLIERVGYYGSELVTNGGFDTDSAWNKTGTWQISNGQALGNGNGTTQYLSQDVGIVYGKTYKITYTVLSNSLSNDRFLMSGTSAFTSTQISSAIGKNTVYLTAVTSSPSSGYDIRFAISSTNTSGSISIDNVSVVEVLGDRARLNYEIEGGLVNKKPSLLLEPQSTNSFPNSEDYTLFTPISAGTGTNPIITSNYSISPDGTKNADRIQFNRGSGTSGGDTSYITKSLSLGTIDATLSIYLKTNDGTTKDITLRLGAALFDYDVTVTSEWQRFTLSGNTNVDRIQILLYGNKNSQTADLSCFGTQVESLTYATSYIPTNGSTQTRAAETCNGAGTSSILPSEEGILYAELSTNNITTFKNISIHLNNTNRVNFFIYSTSVTVNFDVGGATQASLSYSIPDVTSFNKFAFAYKLNNFKLFVNGLQRASDTSGTVPSANTFDEVAFNDSFANNFYGKCRDIRVYNTKEMTDSEVDILLNKITS